MKRNKFSLSHYKLLSCDQGQLIPCGLMEVLPGDTFQHAMSALVRVNPLNAPVMHPVHMRIHHWFVPHRLVWEDWEKFITGGPDGNDASVFPTITTPASTGFAEKSLADYLGIQPGVPDLAVSALPFRGYALIFNEWYRDEDLVTALTMSKASGADSTTNRDLQKIAWEKDYFTTARPWTQKGPAVTLPLGTKARIATDAAADTEIGVYSTAQSDYKRLRANTTDVELSTTSEASADQLYADLSLATSATVNQVRRAFALQRFEEARARYGSRYTEYLRYLGIRSSDARLQRPEYLGGGKQTIQFSEVLQTAPAFVPSDDDQDGYVGSLKGHGIGAARSNRYRRFFEEHGYIYSFISTKPRTMYAQSLARTWNRRTKYDFFQRELQHIGQQEVYNKELFMGHTTPDGVFGYQDRYDEYRRMESSIAGEFRSSLNFWHMAREFSNTPSPPALNGDFVTATPTDRVYADTSTNELLVMAMHSVQARRMVAAKGSSHIF